MSAGLEGRKCESCYGEGSLPTDQGPMACPDCGGSGVLPRPDTHVEWRLREAERTFGVGSEESAQAVRWLAFELRRARAALMEVLALSGELPDSAELVRLRFSANRALSLYDEVPVGATSSSSEKPPG
jgi:hypothetical protein